MIQLGQVLRGGFPSRLAMVPKSVFDYLSCMARFLDKALGQDCWKNSHILQTFLVKILLPAMPTMQHGYAHCPESGNSSLLDSISEMTLAAKIVKTSENGKRVQQRTLNTTT